ncbi:hypothetical protein, partial [Mycolicibacterium vinylchloridicum]|uniref:hypothetical protein n=1 Tax=Mycolicibacterium vinylchloridicum TaxID=2736928 RepID=UPI001C53A6A1
MTEATAASTATTAAITSRRRRRRPAGRTANGAAQLCAKSGGDTAGGVVGCHGWPATSGAAVTGQAPVLSAIHISGP